MLLIPHHFNVWVQRLQRVFGLAAEVVDERERLVPQQYVDADAFLRLALQQVVHTPILWQRIPCSNAVTLLSGLANGLTPKKNHAANYWPGGGM